MAKDGGPRAWAFLRRNPAYRAECRRAFVGPELEAAPFPVRVQSKADGQARAWGLLAWEDPDAENGPASPFWAEAPMLRAGWAPDSPPLRGFLAGPRTRVEGLRLPDGTMILKIEKGGAAVQVRIPAGTGAAVGARLEIRVGFGPGLAQDIGRLRVLNDLACSIERAPRSARVRADRELLAVLDGRLAGKSWRETAVDLYGAHRVAGQWHPDSWMRARVRRRGRKARALMESGYRELAAGRRDLG